MVTITLKQKISGLHNSLIVEKYYPQFWALIAAVLSYLSGLTIAEDQALLLSTTVTFGAIVFGFVGTSLSILTSLGTVVMQRFRETEYLSVMRLYLGYGLGSGVILSCISIVILLFKFQGPVYTALWAAALVFCLTCLYRLGKTMLYVFSDPENRP